MAKVKSPSLSAFKAQLREMFITEREAERARKIRDDHAWIVSDQQETLDMKSRQDEQLKWFMYGWNAALSQKKEPKP